MPFWNTQLAFNSKWRKHLQKIMKLFSCNIWYGDCVTLIRILFLFTMFFSTDSITTLFGKNFTTVKYVPVTACLTEEQTFFCYLVENNQRYLSTLLKQEHYQKKPPLLKHFLYGLINISENSNILHEYIKLLQGGTSILKPYQHKHQWNKTII